MKKKKLIGYPPPKGPLSMGKCPKCGTEPNVVGGKCPKCHDYPGGKP